MLTLTQRVERDGRSTVKLIGELDAATRPTVQGKLAELVESEDTVIDLEAASFIDLGSVRMLVGCRERGRLNGRLVEIVNAPPYVDRMLEMLDRGHYWRPQHHVRRGEGTPYEPPLRTTPDAQRSRPESEQIVRLECPACGSQTFRRESLGDRICENCGSGLEVVAVFRDRRRGHTQVERDRRREG